MSPRQKTALKNRAQGDLPEGETDPFDSATDELSTDELSTDELGIDELRTSGPNINSPTQTTKQRKKKKEIPKKEEFGDFSEIEELSTKHPLPSPHPSSPNPLTIDSSKTKSKEFIDALTDSIGKSALQLVAKTKSRSQQLTFDSLIKGATKLELCSLEGKPSKKQFSSEQDKKETTLPVRKVDKKKAAARKKGKKLSEETPTVITTNEAVEKMESALKGLGKLEGEVMNALFPTDGSLPQSYELIANRFGMSVEEVKGIADNALRGLRGSKGPNGRISTVWN